MNVIKPFEAPQKSDFKLIFILIQLSGMVKCIWRKWLRCFMKNVLKRDKNLMVL